MKRFWVINCVICFLLAAVVLMPCALAAEEYIFVGTATCPRCRFELSSTRSSCGKSVVFDQCPKCKNYSNFTFFCPCIWLETSRTEPTTEEEGIITYTCPSCGETKTESISKLEPVVPDECAHEWEETGRIEPTETTPGKIMYVCPRCGSMKTESLSVKPEYNGTFMNWLGSVLGLFNMTLNSIMGLPALRLFAGVLVFLTMFSLLAQLLRQGRKGRL